MSPFINIQRYAAPLLIFSDMQISPHPSWICKLAVSIDMQIRPRPLMNMQITTVETSITTKLL